jgi:hypothetical protein
MVIVMTQATCSGGLECTASGRTYATISSIENTGEHYDISALRKLQKWVGKLDCAVMASIHWITSAYLDISSIHLLPRNIIFPCSDAAHVR